LIKTFRHRGLKRLFHDGDGSKLPADQIQRIADAIAHLDAAMRPADVDLPGYRLHQLKGDLKGLWSASITANRRIIFRFEDGKAFDVDFVDYH
jgi:proteic killer suppression protein